MKIRHILPGFGRIPSDPQTGSMSGIVGVAYNLAMQQAAHGWETELVGLAGPDAQTGTRMLSHGLRVTWIRPWKWLKVGSYDFRYVGPAAVHLLLRGRADVHHVYSNPYLLAPGRAATRVLHYQTPIGEAPQAYQKAVQRADAVICCSAFIRDQFLHHVAYPRERVYVVHNGVDLERFRPGDRQTSRARLDILADETIILFAGQVNEEKGLLHLVSVCRRLVPHYNLRLLIAGSSSLWGGAEELEGQTPYERQIAEELSELKATFLGKVAYNDMPAVYQAADVFVCPSVWDDPFPLVNLEAMATGLPVVATRAGGNPEAIVDGVTGFLVPPADADALAGALRGLLDNPSLRQRMGEEGLRRAQEFTWEAIAGQVEGIYDEVRAGR